MGKLLDESGLTTLWTKIKNNFVKKTDKASASSLGLVKIGSGVNIDSDGKISVNGSVYTLPIASSSVLGGIKVGGRLSIDSSTGVLTAESQTDENFTHSLKTKLDGMVDRVIEKGTDVNGWTYEKWDSGKLTAYKRKTHVFTSGQVSQIGSVYMAVITENLPYSAVAKDKYVYASHQGGYSTVSVPRYSWCGECRALQVTSGTDPIDTTSNTPLAVYVFGATIQDLTSSPGAAFDFYFTGSWK